ncbi:conserved protein, unknown function, partial [Hepatocystis sp. ex Piliocolobus tephrosceles]
IVLTYIYLKGITLWSIAISIICKNIIVSVIRKLSSVLVTLSYVLFDFLNFIKINELYDPLHHLLYGNIFFFFFFPMCIVLFKIYTHTYILNIQINTYSPYHYFLSFFFFAEMNSLIDIFKFYKEDILDNKYQYSYNLYKGLSYLFKNKSLNY